MTGIGLLLLTVGCITAAVAAVMLVVPKISWLGNLPGDIHYQGKRTEVHFPVVTCIVISVVLTVVMNVLPRLFKR
jgi:uncharacterized membrane-anchored protein